MFLLCLLDFNLVFLFTSPYKKAPTIVLAIHCLLRTHCEYVYAVFIVARRFLDFSGECMPTYIGKRLLPWKTFRHVTEPINGVIRNFNLQLA